MIIDLSSPDPGLYQRLRKITEYLGALGVVFPAVMVIQAVLTAYLVLNRSKTSLPDSVLILIIGVAALAVAIAFTFDAFRKEGDLLFSQISDDFQEKGGSRHPGYARYRSLLRDFAQSSELPLLPVRSGPFIYLVFSLGILLVQFWLISSRP